MARGRPQQRRSATSKNSGSNQTDAEKEEDLLGLPGELDRSGQQGFDLEKDESERWETWQTEAERTAQSGQLAKNQLRKKDDFDPLTHSDSEALQKLQKAQAAINAPALRRDPNDPKDALSVLHQAQDPGAFFQEYDEGGAEEEIPAALLAAIEKVKALLGEAKGLHRVGPGKDDAGSWVVLVSVARGFTKGSFAKLPGEVDGFKTLLALPFDALPLRRDSL